MNGRTMPDSRERCPRCKSANILSSPLGEKTCEDCRHPFGLASKPSYQLDREGNKTFLDGEMEARHKTALAKAAGKSRVVIGIDPVMMRDVLLEARDQMLKNRDSAPWYRFDLRIKYKAYAAAYTGVAKQFTGL